MIFNKKVKATDKNEIVIMDDLISVRTNIKDVSFTETIDDVEHKHTLYEFDEIQMTRDEFLVYLFERINTDAN